MTLGALSDLQISLLAAGACSVAGVWGYNLWQERKHRKLAQRVFRSQQSDVLMDVEGDAEPEQVSASAIESESAVDSAPVAIRDYSERIEPVMGEAAESAAETMPVSEITPVVATEPPPANLQLDETAVASVNAAEPSVAVFGEKSPVETVAVSEPKTAPIPPIPSAPPVPEELVDNLLDCVIELTAPQALAGHALLAAQRRQLGLLAGRARWYGYEESSDKADAATWHALQDYEGQQYHHLRATLQLVDRSGAISTTDLTQFIDAVRQLSEMLHLHMSHPVGHELLAHAQALDEFCASVDWRLCVNLVRRDGLTLPLLGVLELAEAAALQRGEDGCYHALDASGRSVFTVSGFGGQPLLATQATDAQTTLTLAGVSLTLDVPRVADGCEVYDRMLRLGRQMAIALDGALVDEQRAVLSDAVLTAIRSKIIEFQQQMANRQIPAGGRRALRLYS